MAGRQAKILAPNALRRMLLQTRKHACPARSVAIILLSIKAGLRAGEIAKLEWPMVLDARGKVANTIAIEDRIAKKKSGRRIPMHPDIQRALIKLRPQSPDNGPVIRSNRGSHMKANSIVNWFAALYRDAGLDGCSSHSGRRTFVTQAARMTHKAGGSLRDVQLLAGHQSIETTQRYIDGSSDAQRKLIQLL
jgi:integrase